MRNTSLKSSKNAPPVRSGLTAGLWEGVRNGWWEDVDEDAMLPIKVFKRSDFHEHATWAHVFTHGVKKFPSVKEAKRAGLGVPLEPGTKRIGTYIVRVDP